MKNKIQLFVFVLIILTVVNVSKAQNKIEIGHKSPGEITYASFKLNSDASVHISTVGAIFPDRNNWGFFSDDNNYGQNIIYYGWILNSDTREVVWHLIDEHPDVLKKHSKYLHSYDDDISLPAGKYEIYYTGARYNMQTSNNHSAWQWLIDFMGLDGTQFDSEYASDLFMNVTADNNFEITDFDNELLKTVNKNAVVNSIRMRNNEDYSKSFSLSKTTTFKVYSIGEATKSTISDYAWIYSLDQNKVIWMMNYKNTFSTGGAAKNIEFNSNITLPEGNYKVYYKTDDSHAFQSWNSFPPDDPFLWGIVMKIPDKSEIQNFKELNNFNPIKPIVQITSVGDDEYRVQGFTLSNSMDVHIICLGERTSNDKLVDYGKIINADTRETVWEMKKDRLEPGGGGSKNRMIDETIHLEKGNYIVSYVTDGSHSYFNWNATEPFDPELWGITIWPVKKSDGKNVSLFSEDKYRSKNVIAQIVRVRDYTDRKESFNLDRDSKVRVYALGEGTGGRMVDYGWIENKETGKIVWDMSYIRTGNAGGAGKNRMINEVIMLPRGNYILYYTTDDSHSFNDWNANPPDDQDNYGITVSYVN